MYKRQLQGFSEGTRFYAELLSYDDNGNLISLERGEAVHTAEDPLEDPLDKDEYTYLYLSTRYYDELDRLIRTEIHRNYIRDPEDPSNDTSDSEPLTTIIKRLFDGRIEKRRKLLEQGAYADTEYRYDAASRLTAVYYPQAPGDPARSYVTYQYDKAGNVTCIHSFDYDSVDQTLKEYITYMYYDPQNRQTDLIIEGCENADRGKAYLHKSYTYDFRGNLQKVTTWSATHPSETALVVDEFTYDGLNRLILAVYDSEGLNIQNETIYDDAFRKVTKKDGKDQMTIYEYHGALE